ncbi:Suppressor of Sensor Kinase (SLN1) [Tulasnella sp. 418]|nr:Suppressor of Sensor Kinase (SLN1) [Tulasnella sp. 418]
MSQFIEEASSITGFTTTNAYLGGTDRFMCPEILEEQPKTIATDIWALGCLIVQILTDEIPYQHIVRKHAITLAIMRGEPPMSNASGTVKESLWDCIKNCWSRDPTQRPGASDIKSRLEGSDNEVEPSGMRNSIWHKIKPNLCSSMSFTEFSPDGRFLAIVDSIGIVSILEAKNNELEPFKTWSCDKEEPGWHIRKVAWSATQRHLLIISDRFTRIYVVETGELLKDVGPSTTAAFISDDRDVAYAQCSQRSQVSRRLRLLYFAYAGKTLSNRVSFDNNIIDPVFVSNNERAVLALTRVLLVYNLHTRAVENRVQISEQAQMLSVSKDRRFVLVAYRSRDPELWEVAISRPELANSTSQLSLLHKYQSSDGGNGFTKIQFG